MPSVDNDGDMEGKPELQGSDWSHTPYNRFFSSLFLISERSDSKMLIKRVRVAINLL